MFSKIDLLKRYISCGTILIFLLKLTFRIFFRFMPFTSISPSLGSYNPSISLIRLLFPDPDLPTMATFSPGLILRFIFFRTLGVLFEYPIETSLNSMLLTSSMQIWSSLSFSSSASMISFTLSRYDVAMVKSFHIWNSATADPKCICQRLASNGLSYSHHSLFCKGKSY